VRNEKIRRLSARVQENSALHQTRSDDRADYGDGVGIHGYDQQSDGTVVGKWRRKGTGKKEAGAFSVSFLCSGVMAERRFLVKTAYSVPLLLWLALIFGFSSQSYTEQSVQPFLTSHVSSVKLSARIPDWTIRYRNSVIPAKKEPFRFLEFIFRKCAHMFMYGMLAIWCYVALKPHSLNRAVKFGVVLLFAAMVAMTDEWNQTRAVQRTGAIQDVGIDMMGAAMGLAAVFLILVIQKKKQSR